MQKSRQLNIEKSKAILNAAIQEFYTKGYEGSSMDTISKEANVSKATVYNHFKNKEELFLAIVKILTDEFEKDFEYSFDEKKTIKRQLTEIAQKEMDFLNKEKNIQLIQIITIVMIQKNDIGLKILKENKKDRMSIVEDWFNKAKELNLLEFDDTTFVSKQFIGLIKTFAFYPQLYGAPLLSKKDQEKTIKKSVDMILKLYTK